MLNKLTEKKSVGGAGWSRGRREESVDKIEMPGRYFCGSVEWRGRHSSRWGRGLAWRYTQGNHYHEDLDAGT